MAYIAGVGQCVPSHVVTNAELSTYMETSDEWIQQRSGIKERRWARRGNESVGEMGNSDMAERAARSALTQARLTANDIDAIVYATMSPDNEFPGSGTLLAQALCPDRAIPVFEVCNHCTGFLYGLSVARAYIDSGAYRTVLLIGSELLSTGLMLSNEGRATAVLFGDGCGAAIVRSSEDPARSILSLDLVSDGAYADKLGVLAPSFARPAPIEVSDFEGEAPAAAPRMDGPFIFKMASLKMPEIILSALTRHGLSAADLDIIVPHQANQRILDMLGQALGCPEKVLSTISRYGNTTAATIPVALSEAVAAGKISKGKLVCLVSFGAGVSWGAALIKW
ncbi:MAG: beta-ketoacyl-ACP synthase 3 [Deltaproteobacteria bacterium]|nr:beta-ketoacyl-ACP synthase 3 [Deltaproteobacteria bacterium]